MIGCTECVVSKYRASATCEGGGTKWQFAMLHNGTWALVTINPLLPMQVEAKQTRRTANSAPHWGCDIKQDDTKYRGKLTVEDKIQWLATGMRIAQMLASIYKERTKEWRETKPYNTRGRMHCTERRNEQTLRKILILALWSNTRPDDGGFTMMACPGAARSRSRSRASCSRDEGSSAISAGSVCNGMWNVMLGCSDVGLTTISDKLTCNAGASTKASSAARRRVLTGVNDCVCWCCMVSSG